MSANLIFKTDKSVHGHLSQVEITDYMSIILIEVGREGPLYVNSDLFTENFSTSLILNPLN